MAAVLGIGGVFFKSRDPAAMRAWYTRVLGVSFSEWGGAKFAPPTKGSQNITPFAEDSGHFAPSSQRFMLNLVVDDLDGMVAKIEAAGEKVLGREAHDGFGAFAWLLDPDGVKIELWQPA